MKEEVSASLVMSWLFALLVITIGILNLVLVHPVPGIVYIVLSFVYLPPVNAGLKRRFEFTIPFLVKIVLGIIIIWFTLGISDLGDMMDKAAS